MNCPPLQSIEDYLIGALAQSERRTLEEHLETCSSCRQTLAHEQELDDLLRALPNLGAPEGFSKSVLSKMAAKPASRSLPDWLWALGVGLFVTFLGIMASRFGAPFTKELAQEVSSFIHGSGVQNRLSDLGAISQSDWLSQLTTGNNVFILNFAVAGIVLCWGLWQVVKALRG
ncbi:MAG: zf-HC2 domain-containing protein [bacterium]|nr:zf-HC2 domain-containing protein [bacterium]